RSIGLVLLTIVIFFAGGCKEKNDATEQMLVYEYTVPVSGNSWVTGNPSKNRVLLGEQGITNWNDKSLKIRTYFRVEKAGELYAGIVGRVENGSSKIKVTIGKQSKEVTLENVSSDTITAGIFDISEPGYHWVEFEG